MAGTKAGSLRRTGGTDNLTTEAVVNLGLVVFFYLGVISGKERRHCLSQYINLDEFPR